MAKRFLTDISVGKVTDLALPTQPQDAASKEYVDNSVTPNATEYSALVPAGSTVEVMRIAYASVRSVKCIVDIQNQFTYGKSYEVMFRKMGIDVTFTEYGVIGYEPKIDVNFSISGTDIIAEATNTYASANVTVYIRTI